MGKPWMFYHNLSVLYIPETGQVINTSHQAYMIFDAYRDRNREIQFQRLYCENNKEGTR